MMPLRAWEFLIGAVAALYLTDKGSVRKPAVSWIGVLGAAGLLAVQLFPVDGEKTNFLFGHPGLAALLTCVATMLILVYGLPTKLTESRAVKPFIYLGAISYSIYLVHFPVIVFYFYEPFSGTILSHGDFTESLVVLAVILVLSVLCYYLIEKPGPKLNQVLIGATVSLGVIVTALVSERIIHERFSASELGFLLAHEDRDQTRCGQVKRLLRVPNIIEPFGLTCLLEPTGPHDKSVLLVGNSHADSIKSAFSEAANANGYNTYFVVDNTPLMPGGMSVEQLLSEAKLREVDFIVTHHSPKVFSPEVYHNLHQAAENQDVPVVVIAPIPVYSSSIPKAIYSARLNGQELVSMQTKQEHAAKTEHILKTFESIYTENSSTFSYYDPSSYLCDENCRVIGADGHAWYMDDGHLTLSGAAQLKPMFDNIFKHARRVDVEVAGDNI